MQTYLNQFFFALYQWILAGCPDNPIFKEEDAICGNLERYFKLFPYHRKPRYLPFIMRKLESRFDRSGLSVECPFNQDQDAFLLENMDGAHWRNDKRLAFVTANASGMF